MMIISNNWQLECTFSRPKKNITMGLIKVKVATSNKLQVPSIAELMHQCQITTDQYQRININEWHETSLQQIQWNKEVIHIFLASRTAYSSWFLPFSTCTKQYAALIHCAEWQAYYAVNVTTNLHEANAMVEKLVTSVQREFATTSKQDAAAQ